MKTTVTTRGRPKTSPLTRAEQLRAAKRAQRQRERRAGLSVVELRLPTDQADRLRAAVKAPGFKLALDRFLEKLVLDIDQWPGLRELAWNRADRWIPSEEALSIYERNWRFVDPRQLSQDELELIDRLKQQFGGGGAECLRQALRAPPTDLAMARTAYGSAVSRALAAVTQKMREDKSYKITCVDGLDISEPKILGAGIKTLTHLV